ncbi:unnamed protein product [Lepidochelys olivacea]
MLIIWDRNWQDHRNQGQKSSGYSTDSRNQGHESATSWKSGMDLNREGKIPEIRFGNQTDPRSQKGEWLNQEPKVDLRNKQEILEIKGRSQPDAGNQDSESGTGIEQLKEIGDGC